MKKGLGICCLCVGIIGLTAYFAVKSHANNSNASASYEYYYNNNGVYKDDTSMASNEQLDDIYENNVSMELPADIDTDPTSLTVFVNKEYGLPKDYIPSDLVEPDIKFYFSYYDEKRTMRKDAAAALEKLVDAASEKDLEIVGVSGFRSYQRQKAIYNKNVRTIGQEQTDMYSAVPGYSEHQTGWAIDLSCESVHYDLDESFGETSEGKWLAKNCYKYGFIIRYPKGKESLTGYAYEPWHVRYVGVELATYLTENDMTLENYYNYTPSNQNEVTGHDSLTSEEDTVTTTPTPKPTAKATAKPKATATPKPTTKPTVKPTKEPTKDSDKDDDKTSATKPTKKPTNSKSPTPSKDTNTSTTPTPSVSPTPTKSPVTSVVPKPSTPEVNTPEVDAPQDDLTAAEE